MNIFKASKEDSSTKSGFCQTGQTPSKEAFKAFFMEDFFDNMPGTSKIVAFRLETGDAGSSHDFERLSDKSSNKADVEILEVENFGFFGFRWRIGKSRSGLGCRCIR